MANEPTRGTKTEYIATLDALAKSIDRLEADAARRAIRLLYEAQKEIRARIGDAEGWRLDNLTNLQAQVDDIMRRFQKQLTDELGGVNAQAYRLGAQAVDDPLRVSGLTLAPARLNPQVIAVLQGFSADLITRIGEEVRTTVNATIAQSMLGLMSPFEAQKRITQIIGGSDSLKDLTGISARAESIFRTETGRIYSIATQARQNEVAELAPDVVKVWTATGDNRTRDGHLQAHGQAVKVDEFFEVAPHIGDPKEKLMYPRDPRGSPSNVIGCRCRSVTYREGYGKFLPETTARVDSQKAQRGIAAQASRRYWMLTQ